jgi:hypothetical protein
VKELEIKKAKLKMAVAGFRGLVFQGAILGRPCGTAAGQQLCPTVPKSP